MSHTVQDILRSLYMLDGTKLSHKDFIYKLIKDKDPNPYELAMVSYILDMREELKKLNIDADFKIQLMSTWINAEL